MKTPITYFGGKQTMLKHILPLIPKHEIYTEAFCGGCAVFFAKDPASVEVINDVNMHLTNFYWIAKTAYGDLKKQIEKTLHSRDIHSHAAYMLSRPQFFTAVERAWAVWALSKLSFASMQNGTFGYDFKGQCCKALRNGKARITDELEQRLDKTTIENKNAFEVLKKYDKPMTFHFIDPPYVNTSCAHYEGVWNEQDLSDLLKLLTTLKGRWMLTMFPNSEIRAYAEANNWHIHEVSRTISACKTTKRKQAEWIITNY